jgi:hypothetical protein
MNKEYYTSKKWNSIRKKVLKRDNYTCQGCLQDCLKLDVHHLTYERFGDELMCDLISLCRSCHDRIHGKKYDIESNIVKMNKFLEGCKYIIYKQNNYAIYASSEDIYEKYKETILDNLIDNFVCLVNESTIFVENGKKFDINDNILVADHIVL